jgi:hypothetical protein
MKLYQVKLLNPIKVDGNPYPTSWLNVVASSVENAAASVREKYPEAVIDCIDVTKYDIGIVGK